ncbi:ribosomal L32p protein family-domain-containing protein [Rhodocollybia butyracea]|uniref:Large ribosomal subunit protein bL32m n=1 Tax=Rhodocollybia butyracea TaxID=206335 RepID=A0A9P5U8L7_9AGAR|nr:ribosomal L32p protein family-domain-containing protein [Rhodocollybia butyracea]
MASLAFRQSRSILLPALNIPFFTKPLLPALFALPGAFKLPSLASLLEDIFPGILLAVPKKKVSHSRKAMRSANKGLKDKLNLVHCPGCGAPKLAHHLCPTCYSFLHRMWKSEKKDGHNLS